MICIPSLAKTASNMLVNFESRSRTKNLNCAGVCGDTEDVYPAGGVLDDRKAVQAREEHGVAMEEVAGENSVCLAAQKLDPGWTRASRGRIDSSAFEDRPDRGGADLTAHAGEFTGDASVAPARVLSRHAHTL
jgi:hypothetical protein